MLRATLYAAQRYEMHCCAYDQSPPRRERPRGGSGPGDGGSSTGICDVDLDDLGRSTGGDLDAISPGCEVGGDPAAMPTGCAAGGDLDAISTGCPAGGDLETLSMGCAAGGDLGAVSTGAAGDVPGVVSRGCAAGDAAPEAASTTFATVLV